jgi:hypothetical protein
LSRSRNGASHQLSGARRGGIPPGVLDTSTNYVEHPELVAQRICQFAEIVGREQVIAGTDCGFGTFAGYGKLDPDISFKKLRAMVGGGRDRFEAALGPRLAGRITRSSPVREWRPVVIASCAPAGSRPTLGETVCGPLSRRKPGPI